jgi:hypothetical protein
MTEITQKAFLKGSRRFELADDEDAFAANTAMEKIYTVQGP